MKLKRFPFLLAAWLILGGLVLDRPGADPKALIPVNRDSNRIVRFEVLGLKESRVKTMEKTLLQLQGVKALEVDIHRRQVAVTFDIQQTSLKKIRQSLKQESLTPVL